MNSTARLDLAIEHRALAPRLPRCPLSELRATSGGARPTIDATMVHTSRCIRLRRAPALLTLFGLRSNRRSHYDCHRHSDLADGIVRQSRSRGGRRHFGLRLHAWTPSVCSARILGAWVFPALRLAILCEYICGRINFPQPAIAKAEPAPGGRSDSLSGRGGFSLRSDPRPVVPNKRVVPRAATRDAGGRLQFSGSSAA